MKYTRELVFDISKDVIVRQLGISKEAIKETSTIIDELGADSLDSVELIMSFEEEFGIPITEEDAEKMTTVGNAVDGILRLLGDMDVSIDHMNYNQKK